MNNDNNDNNEELLPMLPPPLQRDVTVYTQRERQGEEKYFRQSYVNKYNNRVNPRFVKINDYTKDCKTIITCDLEKIYPHAFKQWSHYGDEFFETTDEYKVIDIATGNILSDWEYDVNTQKLRIKDECRVKEEGICPTCNKEKKQICKYNSCVVILLPTEGDLKMN